MNNQRESHPHGGTGGSADGETAAYNILRLIRGTGLHTLHYRNPGALATIGGNAAVARVKGMKFRGFAAWLVWLVVHLIRLVGFRNRLVVLINRALDYFFFERASCIIHSIVTGGGEEPTQEEEEP